MTLLLSSSTASLEGSGSPEGTEPVFQVLRYWLIANRYRLITILALAIATLLPARWVRADFADDFLAGLRERGWHDTALEYLDQATDDPLATAAFREKLDYERATTQVALARLTAGDNKRQTLLVEAADRFQQFAADKPNSPLQIQALATAGTLLSERAVSAINKADLLPSDARPQREQLYQSARKFLSQAKRPLRTLLDECVAKLKTLPKAAALQKDPQARARLQLLEGKLAEAKFMLAKIDFDAARTNEPGSKSYDQAIKAAAQGFAKLYKDYEDKLVGFYGRFYEGRSYQLSGDPEKALKCFWDIVDQPPIPNQDFRRLVSRSFRYRAECHFASEDFEKVIEECSDWLRESRGPELDQPDWLTVAYQLAIAYEAKAVSASDKESQRAITAARKLYRQVAKNPGEFQRKAKAKMVSRGSGSDKPVLVRNFDDAFAAGKEALEQMNFTKLAARLAKENNPEAVESLTDQADRYQTAATQYFLQATELSDQQTDRDQLASTHYYLCWLHWEAGRLHDAAVIGEFLARRYPENKFAPVAAKLALASYERLYNRAKLANESTEFEAQHLGEVAELLATRWPNSPEAATGLNLLINIALRDNRLADAEKMLERLPPASRAAAELRLGGTLWARYLQTLKNKQIREGKDAAALKQRAGQLLSNGYAALQSKPIVTSAEATGVLYFAQFLLADGKATQAVAALENPTVGPLSLVQNQAAAASRPVFIQETYKVALRAYASVEPPQRKKSQAVMTALESAIGDQADAQQQLLRIYVSLGLQLQQQITALTTSGKTDQARIVAEAFEDLLARVTERASASDDWVLQNWIAQTNLQLGQGLRDEDAARYFRQAENIYQTLLDQAAKDPNFAPRPNAVLATQKRLADCLQAQGKYSEAFKNYTSILKIKPNMFELQQSAATTLQQWGTAKNNAQRLEESIRGAAPQSNRKNLVWGWLRLASIAEQEKRRAAKKASDDPKQAAKVSKYQELFFKARYHVAEARFATAKLASGKQRSKQLRSARQSIKSMQRLYPELGGPQWKEAYQKLLQQMEQVK